MKRIEKLGREAHAVWVRENLKHLGREPTALELRSVGREPFGSGWNAGYQQALEDAARKISRRPCHDCELIDLVLADDIRAIADQEE